MHSCFAFLLALVLTLEPFADEANAELSIDDLLVPEILPRNEEMERTQKLAQKPNLDINIDDLLGPKDIFPFLPDNHRDAGTGKFNSY